jgi:hypothetical protein
MNTKSRIRNKFILELREQGDSWRIFRTKSLIDLIKLRFIKLQRGQNGEDLIGIINLSLKAKMGTYLEKIKQPGSLDEFSKQFTKENESIIALYDDMLTDSMLKLDQYCGKTFYDLRDEVGYLSIINQIEAGEYSDEVFDQIICISINMLEDMEEKL